MDTPKHPSLYLVAAIPVVFALAANAATSDFTRTSVPNWNGREGVTFVRYDSKDSGKVYGSAFVFDLSKGYRLRTWLGDTNADGANRATLGAMAETIFAEGGVAPIAGINGDYFNTSYDVARPTGLTISNSRRVHGGWSNGDSTDYCYLAELGDHNLYHGRLDCAAGYPGGDPTQSWQVNALGRKVRNAVRTNYQNYPVRAGAINPVGGGGSADGYDFSTTIGNYQSRNYYYRTLVGIGTNAVGVATNLVLFSNTVYDGVLGSGIGQSPFRDVDAYQMMIDLGCNEVGELDGGGSATIWSESCPSLQNFFRGGTTAHGGYVNAYRDSSPRAIANGLFVMPPPTAPDTVAIRGANTYPDFDEALFAVVQSDPIAIVGEATISSTNAAAGRLFSFTDPADAAKIRSVAQPGYIGEAVASATADRYTLAWTTARAEFPVPWFHAYSASNDIKGGRWTRVAVRSGGAWPIRPGQDGVFQAYSSRDARPRVEATLTPYGGHLPSKLPGLLDEAVARGDRAALVAVEEDDGSLSLRGLALVAGQPAWVSLVGVVPTPGVPLRIAAEFDFSGGTPIVSYLASTGGSGASPVLSRLRFATGETWLPSAGSGSALAGGVAIAGSAAVTALRGTADLPAGLSAWRDEADPAARGAYAVAVLGDLHFDTLPESVYHENYDESNPYAQTQHEEFRRNGEMWRDRIPSLLAASSALATTGASSVPATTGASSVPAHSCAGLHTRFLLQLGDLVQGDCYSDEIHRQMLDDALAATRAPYASAGGSGVSPDRLPFLTLVGNHDYRNSPHGRGVYFDWAETLLARELGEAAAFPLFSFRIDDDRWIFCDFERVSLPDVAAEVSADPDARYVFLVTHGPFTAYDSANWRWRLSAWTGKGGTGEGVTELFEALSRRRAIVLSGHTHATAFYRNENAFGGYTEFTANSVWEDAALATAEPIHDRPAQYGTYRRSQVSPSLLPDYDADIAFFKAGLREYFFSLAAGHYRLEVTDDRVRMLFYPGAAAEPGRVFDLTPGPVPFPGTFLILK